MEPLKLEDLPANAVVLIDTAPIVYVLEGHPQLAQRFRPIFEAKEAGALQLAITTVTITEVMTGPAQSLFFTRDRDDDRSNYNELAARYREVFSSWRVISVDYDIACQAARLRAIYRLRLPDAVEVASALAINADALVTHDRDFTRLKSGPMRIMS